MWFWLVLILLALGVVPVMIERSRKRMTAEQRKDAPGQFVSLSLGETHYQWHGPIRGPVAVCVHGLTTPSFVWRSMVVGLALMGFRVLTYDLYGRGYSDRPKGKQDRHFFIGQLEELLAHEKVSEEVTLIGYSMGGAIATVFAAKNVHMVRQLILIAPAGMGVVARGVVRFIVRTPVIGDWLMLAAYPSVLRKGVRAENFPEVGELQERELDYQGFVPAVLASMRGILSALLEKPHRKLHEEGVPVLAIWGRDDAVIPLSAMGKLAEWSRNARQEVIEGAGHGVTYTHTEEVLEVIRRELRDTRF